MLEKSELLKRFSLDTDSQKLMLLPYDPNFDLSSELGNFRYDIRPTFSLAWLKGLFVKSGYKWPDALDNEFHFQIAGIEKGRGGLTVVMPVNILQKMIGNADYSKGCFKHRASERAVKQLEQIKTDRLLILVMTEQVDYTDFDDKQVRQDLSELVDTLASQLPTGGFVPYNLAYMKRGALVRLKDGRRAIAINGFNLGGEPHEESRPVRVLAIDEFSAEDLYKNWTLVLPECGLIADKYHVDIHPKYVCDSKIVDAIYLYDEFFTTLGMDDILETNFNFDAAVALSAKLYSGVTDFAGEPYLLHVFRVIDRLKTPEERICALLHDVLVACPDVSINQLYHKGVPLSVLRTIVALTPNPDENLNDYIRRVKMNPVAVAVKRNCLLDDMDLNRLKGKVTEEDIERKARLRKALTLL